MYYFSNNLTELPSWLQLCEDLEVLDCSRNSLSELPAWMPLAKITYLSLHHNKISQITGVVNNSLKMNEEIKHSSNNGNHADASPPPPPPRMPTLRILKTQKSSLDNDSLFTSPVNKSRLSHKRPAPPPPSSDVHLHILPPAEYRGTNNQPFPESPVKNEPNHMLNSPPPIPPLPDHLRLQWQQSSDNVNSSKDSVLHSEGSNDSQNHYEICDNRNNSSTGYKLKVLLLHHNRIKFIRPSFMDALEK